MSLALYLPRVRSSDLLDVTYRKPLEHFLELSERRSNLSLVERQSKAETISDTRLVKSLAAQFDSTEPVSFECEAKLTLQRFELNGSFERSVQRAELRPKCIKFAREKR